jgi:type I restriction enzyme S subunit
MRSPDYWHQIGNASAGVALANVNASKLTDLAIPVAPFAEQKRIADKLDNLMVHIDVCRDRLDRLPTIIKQFRQSVLDAATSGRLTEECREKNCVSRKWAERSLLSLTTKITDGEHITPKRSPNGKCLLSARNIQNGSIALGNVDYVDDLEFDRIRRRCDPEIGDVLLSCSGSVGRVALVDRDNFYVMVRSAAMIRPRRELLNATYLMYSLQSPALQSQIKAKSSATAQANIFLGAIRELVLPLPGLPEQAEIVRRVEALFALADRLEARVKTASARIDTLTPATLAKALRGELVPQDPSDEPARALLGRIRAERAAPVEVRPRTRRRAAS